MAADHKVWEICVEKREIFTKLQRPKRYGPLDPKEHVVEIHVFQKKSTLEKSLCGVYKTLEA
jgi:hypothetical protein